MPNNNETIDDEILQDLVRQASDPAARPRPEYVEQLRTLLLAQTVSQAQRPSRMRWLVIAAAAALAASLLLSFLFFRDNAAFALADVFAAGRERPWVHGTLTLSGTAKAMAEYWVSPQKKLAAYHVDRRFGFDDFVTKVSKTFDAQEGTLYCVPLPQLFQEDSQRLAPAAWEQLLMNSRTADKLFHNETVAKLKRTNVVERGKRWIDYDVVVRRTDRRDTVRTIHIRLDGQTRLPTRWDEELQDGRQVMTRFDYPSTGPRDIYDLGVPKTARVVDRIPSGDLVHVASALKAGRVRFDDYDAIVENRSTDPRIKVSYAAGLNMNVRRVRRRGGRYRIDALVIAKPALQEPKPNADMAKWWHDNRENFWSVPNLICDGQERYFYRMLRDRVVPGQKPDTEVVLQTQLPVDGSADDPPATWPQLMPEYFCRPYLEATNTRDLHLDTKPTDGPAGTWRVIDTSTSTDRGGELYRFWFDPKLDFAARKTITRVFEHESSKLAYIDTDEFDDFAQSPSGIWYPRTGRRTTTTDERFPQVTKFYLDFDVKLSDDLFQPVHTP